MPVRVMPALCHKPTSFDHAICAAGQGGRHVDAERLGRLQVDDEFEHGSFGPLFPSAADIQLGQRRVRLPGTEIQARFEIGNANSGQF